MYFCLCVFINVHILSSLASQGPDVALFLPVGTGILPYFDVQADAGNFLAKTKFSLYSVIDPNNSLFYQ